MYFDIHEASPQRPAQRTVAYVPRISDIESSQTYPTSSKAALNSASEAISCTMDPSTTVSSVGGTTLLSIVFMVVFLFLMNFGFINISVFLFSIIGISVITLPHAIIMTNFYNKK